MRQIKTWLISHTLVTLLTLLIGGEGGWKCQNLKMSEFILWRIWAQIGKCQNLKIYIELQQKLKFSYFSESKSVRYGECRILTLSNSDTFRFWHFLILTLSNSDTFRFWYFQILILSNSDTFKFWHFQFLTLLDSDTFRFQREKREFGIFSPDPPIARDTD